MIPSITLTEAVTTSATKGAAPLGTRAYTPDGREWVYCYNESGAQIDAYLALTRDEDMLEHEDCDTNAEAETYGGIEYAAKQVITGAVALSLDEAVWAGALGIIDDGDGKGQVFKVEENSETKLYLEAALGTALGTSNDSDITVFQPWWVEPLPASTNRKVVGLSQADIADAYYFWMLVRGHGVLKVGAASHAAEGTRVVTGDDTAGYGALASANPTGLEDVLPFGTVIKGSNNGDGSLTWINVEV